MRHLAPRLEQDDGQNRQDNEHIEAVIKVDILYFFYLKLLYIIVHISVYTIRLMF